MDALFFKENRERLAKEMEAESLAVFYCGEIIRRSCDENYEFFANRNFLYLTGVDQKDSVLLLEKRSGEYREVLYVLEPDFLRERWDGQRLTTDQAQALSGVSEIKFCKEFDADLAKMLGKNTASRLYLDLDRHPCAGRLAAYVQKEFPQVRINNALPILKRLRIIKCDAEIKAMEIAQQLTRDGIIAMMQHSKPGMYEYQYKAIYDYSLAMAGAGAPPFTIISAGRNNFCIHYDRFCGQAGDGDMILNDVGARWDYEVTDVSRGWPCNGKFDSRQKLLYECAYRTSEYMFGIIKPGMPMADVDAIIRRYNYEQLNAAGVCKDIADVGRYMWHGGAHHVGLDIHDAVDAEGALLAPGMVFCVDIGIYHEEWGIGFRLEDNCLVTKDGCRNLSAGTPRTIAEIEEIMNG